MVGDTNCYVLCALALGVLAVSNVKGLDSVIPSAYVSFQCLS